MERAALGARLRRRGRRRARRSPRCARASCRSSRRRCRRRSARRTRRATSASGSGLLGEDRLAVRALDRDAGVRDAVDRQRRGLAEEADRVAHVLGAGRAVQAEDVDVERLERRQHRADVGAEQHLAAVGQQRDARSGSGPLRPTVLNASRAPKIAALTSRMSCAVSMMSRSTPPSSRPRPARRRRRRARGSVMLPSVGSSEAGRRPVGPIEPATKRSSPTALRAICAAPALISSVCSPRPHSSSFRRLRLEGVGLDDLGAGLDHRARARPR